MENVTDGASNTYMIGEKYLNPDAYYTGLDGADNESATVGYDNDTNRCGNAVAPPPCKSTRGFVDEYSFEKQCPSHWL